MAVVAIGGYGRGDMCLFSDVDVMILHHGADLDRVTGAVLYPLWDANLKVGHSVRTVKEAVDLAAADFDSLTALLTMRTVAGEASLVAELETALRTVLRRSFVPTLVERERERRDLDPYPVMNADLKEGRGGLRTFQSFIWERRRAELLGESTAESDHHVPYGTLLAVRNALHAASGRGVDRFHAELRPAAARWLGKDVEEVGAALCASLHAGDRAAERMWPELLDGASGSERRWPWRRRSATSGQLPTSGSALSLALDVVVRPETVWRDTPVSGSLQSSAWQKQPWTDEDRQALLAMLQSGARGRAALALLTELGWVSNHFPEWSIVATRPQLAPFHEHPVGAHLWRTVDEMQRLRSQVGDDLTAIAGEVDDDGDLTLAAFFHDLGKGHGGDHSVIGAELARQVLTRFGFGAETIDLVSTVTRHHLLLTETATRRDLDDAAVIDEIVTAVGDLRTLQVLYLLSIADARATGGAMLSEWKATLLRTAYARAAAAFGDGVAGIEPRIEAAVAVAASRHDPFAVRAHVEAMDPSYLWANTAEEIAWHLDGIEALGPGAASSHLAVHDTAHGSRVAFYGADRTGLLGVIATVFAVHGISIRGARLFTRSDGVAVDVFDVADDRTHGSVPEDRWERVRADLATRDGDGGLHNAVKERARAYGAASTDAGEVDVRAPQTSTTTHTVLEVRCADRIGRLAQIVNALYAEDLDISLAKLDTRSGQVIDTFYVTRDGKRIDDSGEILRTVTAVRTRIRSNG